MIWVTAYVLIAALMTLHAAHVGTFDGEDVFNGSARDWCAVAIFGLTWPWILPRALKAFWEELRDG